MQRRLVEHRREYFYDDAATDDDTLGILPLGDIGLRALSRESRALALTPGLLSGPLEGRATPATLLSEGHYVEEGGTYWTRSSRPVYDPTRFYQPTQSVDPFGHRYQVELDLHSLLVTRTEDPLQNVVLAQNDYRILGPRQQLPLVTRIPYLRDLASSCAYYLITVGRAPHHFVAAHDLLR